MAVMALLAVHAAVTATAIAVERTTPEASPTVGRARTHLVIAPERFREALRAYCEHRRAASPHLTRFEFVTLESALHGGEEGGGRDDAERLKRFLHRAWTERGITSCLLVGDCDTLPMRSMTLDRAATPAFHWAFYPSDLYYADLARADGSFDDWNARTDGFHARYWGEVHGETNKDGVINADGVDYTPEIAIGRWPVSTPEACAIVAAKTIAFETAPPVERPLAAFFAVGGWVDVRERVRAMASAIDGRCTTRVHLHDSEGVAPPTEAAMRDAIAGGARFLLHTGHGQPWGYEGCLSLATLDGVAQPAALPIFLSAGCSTAEVMTQAPYQPYVDVDGVEHAGTNAGEIFTAPPPPPAVYQSGPRNTTSIAEELLRRPNGGAVATVGCVTGSQPCAVTILEGFTAELATSDEGATLGELWAGAIVRYRSAERLMELKPTADWYPPSVFFQGMKFVLLGDPALRVR